MESALVNVKLLAPSNKTFSIPRIVILLGSILVALSSGTHYMYSTYAPQLGDRLRVSHTQLNMIGLAGNIWARIITLVLVNLSTVGVSISGPLWGRITDRKGPRIPLIGASICLLVGYLGIKHMFDDGLDDGATVSAFHLALLNLCSFLTGLGASAGIGAAVNVTAKSFPSSARASTTGLVVSGFGLSAFLFSLLAHALFPGDTSALLFLLALGTAIPIFIGLFIVEPVRFPQASYHTPHEAAIEEYARDPSGDANLDVDSETPLLSYEWEEGSHRILVSRSVVGPNPAVNPRCERSEEDSDGLPDVHGKELWSSPDFYLVFVIEAICSGIGVMYITNIGSISQILYAATHTVYDDVEASEWQAAQVSILSLGNFAGRLLIGLISDSARTRLRIPRAYSLCIVSFLFVVSQAAAIAIPTVETLWIATLLLGLAYGSLFGISPAILIEWFGLAHFSENWGYLCFSLIFGGNLFSLMFGLNLDAHAPTQDLNSSLDGQIRPLVGMVSRELPSKHLCLDGKRCYLGSLQVTLVACIISLGLSWWAGIREGQKIRGRNAH